MEKPEARIFAKHFLSSLDDKAQRDSHSLELFVREFQEPKSLLLYCSDRFEVDVSRLSLFWKKCSIFYPRVDGNLLEFVFPESWKKGYKDLWEPLGNTTIVPGEAEMIVVPALGFHSLGYRLGRGGGFYDQALEGISPEKLIGFSYSQIFPLDFDFEPHDLRVGHVITDTKIERINSGR